MMGDSHLVTSAISFGHTVNKLSSAGNGTRLSNASENELLDQLNDELKRAVTPVSVIIGIEIVLGHFGNLLVLYMFIKRYHHCNFRYFVLCLAFLDLISTLTTMPGEILTQQYWYTFPFPIVCKIKSFFNVFTVSGAAFCLCIIAVDRYRKVCAPFGWQIRPRQAIIVCGSIYCAAFIISIPSWFLWGIHKHVMVYNGRNVTVTICAKDAHYVDSSHPFAIVTSVKVIVSICLVITIVLYVLVAKTLMVGRKFAGRRKHSGPPMVSTASRSQAKSNKKPEITNSDVPTRNGKSVIEFSTTEMRSLHESEPVEVIDLCVLDAETTCGVWTSEERHIQQVRRQRREKANRILRKTYIMFILTIIFNVTTILYMALLDFISGCILKNMNNFETAVYFFFFRLVFINHVINPFVYGCLDPQFQQILRDMKTMLNWLRKG